MLLQILFCRLKKKIFIHTMYVLHRLRHLWSNQKQRAIKKEKKNKHQTNKLTFTLIKGLWKRQKFKKQPNSHFQKSFQLMNALTSEDTKMLTKTLLTQMNKTYLSLNLRFLRSNHQVSSTSLPNLPLFVKATQRSEGEREQGIALSWLWLGAGRELNED